MRAAGEEPWLITLRETAVPTFGFRARKSGWPPAETALFLGGFLPGGFGCLMGRPPGACALRAAGYGTPGHVQPTVDLGTHDVAVGRRVVEPAPQRGGQQSAGVLEVSDLLIEGCQALAGDLLPLGRRGGAQDPVDLVEGQADVLHHADEDQAAERLDPVPALP